MSHLTRLAVAATATALTLAGLDAGLGVAGAVTLDRLPVNVLTGGSTGLDSPAGIAEDSSGNLYVANDEGGSITVYRKDALGNQVPARTISGASTGLEYPAGIAVDKDGYVYVANTGSGTGVIDGILVFAPGAQGDVAPVRAITGSTTTLMTPEGLELEPDGTIVVADQGAEAVDVFAQGGNGDIAPLRQLNGALTGLDYPYGVTVAGGLMYVGNQTSITVYPASANGDPTPLRTITSSAMPFDSVRGLAVDSSGDLYAASYVDGTVRVLAPGANGDVAPSTVLAGGQTQLYNAWGLDLRPDRTLLTASSGGNAVNTYAPIVPFAKPGKVTALKVAGKATATKRKITWKAPAVTGGEPIEAYRLVVTKGHRSVVAKKVTARSYKLRTKRLVTGTYKVKVAAITAAGKGAAAVKKLKVRR